MTACILLALSAWLFNDVGGYNGAGNDMIHRGATAIALLLIAAPAQAQQIREQTTYFIVGGETLAELDAEFSQRGPLVGNTGARHMGATKVEFDGKVTYKPDGRRCRVDTTKLTLDLEVMLPRWKPRKAAAERTALLWRTISRDIERHEREHADIAKTWLRKMENAIRGLGPEKDCDAMEARVERTASIFLRKHEAAQLAFDAKESREIGMRLRRALRDDARSASR